MSPDNSRSQERQQNSGLAEGAEPVPPAHDLGLSVDEVTAAQAATLTGLSERTIRRKIISGKLPAKRLMANRYAIRVRDLPSNLQTVALVDRLDDLERRVQLLEHALVQVLAELATPGSISGSPDENEGSAAVQTIQTIQMLLTQMAQEITHPHSP